MKRISNSAKIVTSVPFDRSCGFHTKTRSLRHEKAIGHWYMLHKGICLNGQRPHFSIFLIESLFLSSLGHGSEERQRSIDGMIVFQRHARINANVRLVSIPSLAKHHHPRIAYMSNMERVHSYDKLVQKVFQSKYKETSCPRKNENVSKCKITAKQYATYLFVL